MRQEGVVVLDNSNIVESYPGITLPLTQSFIEEAYYQVFKGVLLRLTGSRRIVSDNDGVLHEMLGSCQGRVYYQISNWYSILRYLPFSNRIIPIWQEMMGVADKEVSADRQPQASFLRKLVVAKNVIKNILGTPKEMQGLEGVFADAEGYFLATYHDGLDNGRLKALYEGLAQKVLPQWDVTLANDLYAFVFTGLAKRRLPDANAYIANRGTIESMKPIKELLAIVRDARESGEVERIAKLETETDIEEYLASGSPLAGRIRGYLAQYGDRYLEELKLESPTYRTCPRLLLDRIVEYAGNYDTVASAVEGRPLDPPKGGWLTRRFLAMAVTGIKNREASRLDRTRLYGMVRAIFLSLGENLRQTAEIDCGRDVFYLTIGEVFDCIDGAGGDLKATVAARKKEYAGYGRMPAMNRLVFVDGRLDQGLSGKAQGGALSGTPVSSGRVTAGVAVVNDPQAAGDITGKILVTKTTDPGWVFLLVRAAGIIAEKGSLLSHTAIIARELGIPAIVNVPDATSMLKDGDTVTMDGGTGTVELRDV